jgi:F-type H+-transporting ATPase subunit a
VATEQTLTPSSYIAHHLKFNASGEGFWAFHWDTIAVSVVLGVFVFGFLRWVVSGATSGVPSKRQAFVELVIDFVDDQVKGIYHGESHRFVAATALTVLLWVLFLNAMDFLPVDLVAWFHHNVLRQEHFRNVPTADLNTTFALALSVWLLMIYFFIKVKGLGGWIYELFCTPFGKNPLLWIPNLLFNLVELISRPLSHSLRLFGNMYAGEIIFLLLWTMAAAGLVGTVASIVLALGWSIFHILIVALQAYIFMMLTIVYIAIAHEHH